MIRARVILLVNFVFRRRILSKIFIRAYLECLSIDSVQPTEYREDPLFKISAFFNPSLNEVTIDDLLKKKEPSESNNDTKSI